MSSVTKIRVAAAQVAPVYLDLAGSLEKACKIIREAGREGARIIGFPEGFLPGHPHWFHFEPAVSRRSRELNAKLWGSALLVPGPETAALCEAAKDANAYVVMGCCERIPDTSTLYNSQLFISPKGELVGKHQKIVPTHAERVVHAAGKRNHAVVCVPTEFGGRLGGLICGEHFNPLARFALIAKGEMFHVGSWPANFSAGGHQIMYEAKNFAARAHAHEGSLFVINVAGVISKEMKQYLCPNPEMDHVFGSMGGGSAIIGPHGEYIAGPAGEKEEVIYGDIDLAEVTAGKIMHDICGHYQRHDVFTLTLNEVEPQLFRSVTRSQEGEEILS